MPLGIYKRGRIWHCRGTVAGKLVRKSLKTGDRAFAEHAANKIETKILSEKILGKSAAATFSDACTRYFDDHPVSKDRRDQVSAFLIPIIHELGGVRLIDLTPGRVKATARKLYPHWKPQSLNTGVIAPVSAVVNNAQHGWCPPIRIKKFTARDARLQRPIDRDWLYSFMRAAPPHLGALALFQFETGARPSEACSLRPDQVDLDRGQAWSDETKNGKRRVYYLPDDLVAILWNLPPREVRSGKRAGELRVFGYSDKDSLRAPWKKACKAAGIDYRTRYEAGRHSHFTETIVHHRADVVTAAKLGNITPQIALQRYAHADAPERLAREVFGTKSAQHNRKKTKVKAASRG